jgi:hypothetical protein
MRFHIGQKVVCINDRPAGGNSGKGPEILVKSGTVYTVREVISGEAYGYEEDGLLLREIVNTPKNYNAPVGPVRRELFFRTSRFFPVQPTSIDQFMEMLRTVRYSWWEDVEYYAWIDAFQRYEEERGSDDGGGEKQSSDSTQPQRPLNAMGQPRLPLLFPQILGLGRVIKCLPRGHVILRLRDGHSVVVAPGGKVLGKPCRGYVIRQFPDGRVLRQLPNGEMVRELPDGTTVPSLFKFGPGGKILSRGRPNGYGCSLLGWWNDLEAAAKDVDATAQQKRQD